MHIYYTHTHIIYTHIPIIYIYNICVYIYVQIICIATVCKYNVIKKKPNNNEIYFYTYICTYVCL